MDYVAFKQLCAKRRSIRYFEGEPVTKDEVAKLLELARFAPSVENLQPWRFHVVMRKDLRRMLADASCYGNFVEGASVFVVVTSDTSTRKEAGDTLWNPKELEYSCMGAMMQVILGATAMGLGSCWVSLHHGTAHEILGLPRHEIVVGGLLLGRYKPGEEEHFGPQPKTIDAFTVFHE